MDKIGEHSSLEELFTLILNTHTPNFYFVSELFGDKLVLNEPKLNVLSPKMLQEIFETEGHKLSFTEDDCVEFISFLIKRAYSTQSIYHILRGNSRYHRDPKLSIAEIIVGLDFEIGGPQNRSKYLDMAIKKVGCPEMVKDYKKRYYKICNP